MKSWCTAITNHQFLLVQSCAVCWTNQLHGTSKNEEGSLLIRLGFQCVASSEEGERIQNNYRLYALPAIVVIDPITGSAMLSLSGFKSAERYKLWAHNC